MRMDNCKKCSNFSLHEDQESYTNMGWCSSELSKEANEGFRTIVNGVISFDYEGYSSWILVGKEYGCVNYEYK